MTIRRLGNSYWITFPMLLRRLTLTFGNRARYFGYENRWKEYGWINFWWSTPNYHAKWAIDFTWQKVTSKQLEVGN